MDSELCEHRCSRGSHCGGCGCPGCGYTVMCGTPGCGQAARVEVLVPARRESEGDRDYSAPFCEAHAKEILLCDRAARIVRAVG